MKEILDFDEMYDMRCTGIRPEYYYEVYCELGFSRIMEQIKAEREWLINELADMIIKKYGNDNLKSVQGLVRQGENLKPIPDTSKIETIGFKESVNFEEGLDITKKWVEQEIKNKNKKLD